MHKKYDSKLKCEVTSIYAGEYYISGSNEIISTVLGSCVSVCLYDEINGIGGMNHFMLPGGDSSGDFISKRERLLSNTTRYGITSMEILIAELQKKGASRRYFKAKIFGGGRVLSGTNDSERVGDKNVDFARTYLNMEEIPVEREDVGSRHGRKIYFMSGRGKVIVKRVSLETAMNEENDYMRKQKNLKVKSDITLF